jgi:hypothetical protein
MQLPELANEPRCQQASHGWADPSPKHQQAWKELWTLVRHGFYDTANTKMQFINEAGLQTLLATLLVGVATLLGIRVAREEWVNGEEKKGPIEFTLSNDKRITLVVEAKHGLNEQKPYAQQVEQLYEEMWAAREQNSSYSGKQYSGTVWGLLVDAWGSVAFELRDDKVLHCSNYMFVFQGSEAPGANFTQWLNIVLGASLKECRDWDAEEWVARREKCEQARRRFDASMNM